MKSNKANYIVRGVLIGVSLAILQQIYMWQYALPETNIGFVLRIITIPLTIILFFSNLIWIVSSVALFSIVDYSSNFFVIPEPGSINKFIPELTFAGHLAVFSASLVIHIVLGGFVGMIGTRLKQK
ncbi:hypothetical protein COU89_01540 [Candidatus Roizmanbacteria bacterium CG10_big_fil_rev_8_21_14_0_10_45_7]|uniref:Uncharacterized protein n=1 Tax=Candidatus Roizmanbacteria bacterium CG10_big_fil_rev_8_21_14_0_10_45_7 TaxID=1974854 RepID=A0A2M8KUZ1_9BACT|nr:MAG: hypothetical protein COU89_01540 [Candidatus Roizmanbacteria bacterium CG10_big_fil_rev_8_21_14_0_10_45_7]